MVAWNAPDAAAFKKLLAAMLAANELKPFDYRKIATYYGEGATYDAIEGQFRKIRNMAKDMVEEIESGARAEAPARGRAAVSTPVKKGRAGARAGQKVVEGRVGKKRGRPSKKAGLQVEDVEDDADDEGPVVVKGEDDGGETAAEEMDLEDKADLGLMFENETAYADAI